jgi:hypothetical protein
MGGADDIVVAHAVRAFGAGSEPFNVDVKP